MSKILKLVLFLLPLNFSQAQTGPKDPDSLKWKPEFELGLRSYYMSTGYWQDFKNEYALGQMSYLRMNSQLPHGFSLSGDYWLFYRIWSSDLTVLDPRTNNINRYEVGLFDVMDPDQRFFGKMGNLNLTFQRPRFSAKLGRMEINTPFINHQDGRLSPTFVEGLRTQYKLHPRFNLVSDWIWRMSPRSTSGWYHLGETVGMYPMGRNENGTPSEYFGNTSSEFIHVLDLKYASQNAASLQLNHTYVENISSTYLSQYEKTWLLPKPSHELVAGIQGIVQHGIGEGGNPESALRYKNPDDVNYVVGAKFGLKNPNNLWLLNYSKMGGKGRFLNPREWGKDPFYTFIPREKNEGLEHLDAITTFYQHNFWDSSIQLYTFLGVYFLPDPADFKGNKYGFPNYAQMNLGTKYQPQGWGKGLDFHLILMGKAALNREEMAPGLIYNKVNLFHVNMIVNYKVKLN